jgi:hypothetical protein
MKRILFTIGLIALAGPAWSANTSNHAAAIRASMDVSGTITVSARGYVKGYKLDQPGKLPDYVVRLLNRSIPAWRFQPNVRHGKPVNVKAHMDVRLLATPLANKKVSISIDQTTFATVHGKDDQQIQFKKQKHPPKFPWELVRQGVSGTVFLLLRINRKGRVSKAAVEQVNLATRGAPKLMTRWRRAFARSALDAARRWRFAYPTAGKLASADHCDVEVPVQYRTHSGPIMTDARYAYGAWQPYIPGPRHYIPWEQHNKMADHAAPPVGSGIHMVGTGLHRIDNAKS